MAGRVSSNVPRVPSHLQPKAPIAPDAILVGDPGRALLLAQELLEQPKMSNHARGLWGYSGRTLRGGELTIQATGIGAPSAVAVLADLAELGVRRAVRVGTCAGLDADARPGELLLVTEAVAAAGSSTSFGVTRGASLWPDPALLDRLREALGGAAREARVGSVDAMPARGAAGGDESAGASAVEGLAGADMQSAALLARGPELGVALAVVLIVAETAGHGAVEPEALRLAEKTAGKVATTALSNPKIEGESLRLVEG